MAARWVERFRIRQPPVVRRDSPPRFVSPVQRAPLLVSPSRAEPCRAPPRPLIPTSQQRHPEAAQLADGEAAGDGRVILHDLAGSCLVGRLDYGNAGVDLAERRAGNDQSPFGEQPLEALEMDAPCSLFF